MSHSQTYPILNFSTAQWSHAIFGVINLGLSCSILMIEFWYHTVYFCGFWIGSFGVCASISAFAVSLKPTKMHSILSVVIDSFGILVMIIGINLNGLLNEDMTIWLYPVLVFILIYHICTCLLGLLASFGRNSEVTLLESEDADPPLDFLLPHQVPTLPSYEDVTWGSINPPPYNN